MQSTISPEINSHKPFYIKSVRADTIFQLKTYYPNFIYSFCRELANPQQAPFPKRINDMKNFTVTGEGISSRKPEHEDIAPKKCPQYTPEMKKNYTNFQSATLVMPGAVLPRPCAFAGSNAVFGGVIIDFKDSLASNRLYIDDGNTIARPYDFYTLSEAQRYAQAYQNKLYSAKNMSAFIQALMQKADHVHSEPMVRFCWNTDGSSKMAIMKDNLASRLQTYQYALILKKELEKAGRCDHSYNIPIVYYLPDNTSLLFKEYSQKEYDLDCQESTTLYQNENVRASLFKQNSFEFLMGLPFAMQKEALSKIIDNHSVAFTLLRKKKLFVLRVLLENTDTSFSTLLNNELESLTKLEMVELLDTAVRANYEVLANYLYDFVKKDTARCAHVIVEYTMEHHKKEWFQKLVKANVVQPNDFYHACRKQDSDYAQLILDVLQTGIDINRFNKDGKTPLMIAAEHGNSQTVNVILNSNRMIEIDSPNINTGNTALISAASHGHSTVVKILLQKNAKVDAKNFDKKNATHEAFKNGFYDVYTLLDDITADISKKSMPVSPVPLPASSTTTTSTLIRMRASTAIVPSSQVDITDIEMEMWALLMEKKYALMIGMQQTHSLTICNNATCHLEIKTNMNNQNFGENTYFDLYKPNSNEYFTICCNAEKPGQLLVLKGQDNCDKTQKQSDKKNPLLLTIWNECKKKSTIHLISLQRAADYVLKMDLLVKDESFLRGEITHIKTGIIGSIFSPHGRPSILAKIASFLPKEEKKKKNEENIEQSEIVSYGLILDEITRILWKIHNKELTHNNQDATVKFMNYARDREKFIEYLQDTYWPEKAAKGAGKATHTKKP